MTPQTLRRAFRPSVRLVLITLVALIVAVRGSMAPVGQALTSPIVADENARAGTLDNWDVSGAGDPSIQGFATDISVNTGDTVSFKVKTDASNYTIDIYRLGYYNGVGARKYATLTRSTPQAQPDCLLDGITGLADCGNWGVSASWSTAGAVSGIYVAKLTRIGTGGSSHMFFIVRDDARKADVVVQTSDTTWQAYNQYGGGSLYCGGPHSNAGTVYSCTGRATKVSYNRPFDTRAHDATSFLFNAEYPMVRWLEANGYDVKYISGVDTERRAASLIGAQKPKAFFSVGHDEYWSAGQRASVEAARNAGVNLAFFSGNEIYWKTRFEPSVDGTNTPYRTLVGYKDTLGGVKLDPMPGVTTGTWRDTRFGPPVADGGRPENGLIGQIWTVNSGTSAITVPASMANLRLWKNTRVANLTSGAATLGTDTLGYEWGEDLDNGSRPEGLIHLSSTTVAGVEKILDFGETVGVGTATHTLTLYKHASGALVFGAGTVQWAWGLDSNHDRGSAPPDQAMQQATVNLLADFGAQPGSLQIGADPAKPLIAAAKSADVFAPASVVTSPAAGGTVGSGDRVAITGTASDSGGVVAAVEVSVDGGTTWHAAQGTSAWTYEWSPGGPGSVTVRSRAADDSGNREVAGAGIDVSVVAGSCPCPSLWTASTVPSIVDANDESPVELGLKFRSDVNGFVKGVRFYKSAGNTGTHLGNLWTSAGALLATATFTAESPSGWQEVLFDAPVAVTANTIYVVSYHTNVGHYSASGAYFSSLGTDRSPLHAPASATVGGNGVYVYGASAFPIETFNATNYWVDVVFDSTPDLMAPTMSSFVVTPIDGSVAIVTWNTDEASTSRVDYSTDRTFAAAATLSAADAAFVTAHSVRLTGLIPSTVYYYRVRSSDRAGNEASRPTLPPPGTPPSTGGPAPPSFTMPSPSLHDTIAADFTAGTLTGTYVSETGDGEVILAPGLGAEFSGSAMPSGWAARIWSDGGSAAVAGGKLTVDGARVATCVIVGGACLDQYNVVPGTALEFVATFTGDPYQHSGFGTTLESSFEPFGLFSTSWTDVLGEFHSGGSLGVRTFDGSSPAGEIRTNLGPGFLNAPHRFRIDWQPSQIVYSVDGVQVATHAMVVGLPMRPVAASDFNAFSGKIVVDSIRTTPYASSGTFLSRVFGVATGVNWQDINWVADVPAGTTLAISVRTGETATPDASWSAFTPVAVPGALALQSRYIQYRAEMATSDASRTPALADLSIGGVGVPPAQIITPLIEWATPADLTYGTALGATELNATASPNAPGTYAYMPAAGTVLGAGDSQTLSVTFTPDDTTRFASANQTVPINVRKATPAITWSAPAAIIYGTALGATQLNAASTVSGTFAYQPASGAVLGGGAQMLSAVFTPSDSTNYESATANVPMTVLKAASVISWAAPASIMAGTPLGAAQLNASANVAGTFVYTPAAGTVLAAGARVLSVAFTPASAANYAVATASVTITVTQGVSTVVVSSSNAPSLFGVPITLTATVMPAVAGGTVAFKDGTATITCLTGSVLTGPVATCKTSALAVGTHLVKAVYTPSGQAGVTSAAFSQVVSPSAKLQVKFNVYALQDNTSRPRVTVFPAKNALVKVFSTATSCVGNIFSALNPKKWGTIFDGADGVGGADGCAPVSLGSYQATGTTDVNGNVTIIVPPLALSWNTQYLVIGRSTNFDYIKTAVAGDTLYSNYPVLVAPAGTTRTVPLSFVATFKGKIVPGKALEEYGSYLAIIEPEYVDWAEPVEQYPFILVAEGDWSLETSVTPPDGFVADEPVLATDVVDAVTALQFTLTDIGSDWTETGITHVIKHKGETRIRTSAVPMFNKQPNAASGNNGDMKDTPTVQGDVQRPLLPSRIIAKLMGMLF